MRIKEIKGFPNYFIDRSGNVYSSFIPGSAGKTGALRLKKHGIVKGYYKAVLLDRQKKQRSPYVHRLVLENFVGPCPRGMVGCHNDGDSLNNNVKNLRWDTPKNNSRDTKKHGRANEGERNGMAKYDNRTARKIKEMRRRGMTYREISEILNIPLPSVSTVINRWKHLKLKP